MYIRLKKNIYKSRILFKVWITIYIIYIKQLQCLHVNLYESQLLLAAILYYSDKMAKIEIMQFYY